MAAITSAVIGAGAAIHGANQSRRSARDQQRAAEQQHSNNAALIQRQAETARRDALDLFNQSGQDRHQGFQSALNVLGGTVPQQASLFQAGNVNAQDTLLQAMPMYHNAILGGQVDYGQLQPQTFNYNMDFLNEPLQGFQQFNPQPVPHSTTPVTSQEESINWLHPLGRFGVSGSFNPFVAGSSSLLGGLF